MYRILSMARPIHPYSIRRACMRLISDGEKFKVVEKRYGVTPSTMQLWCRQAGIKSRSKISDEELDTRIAKWARKFRDIPLPEDATDAQKRLKAKRDTAKFNASEDAKEKHALSMLKDLGDPKVYHEALTEHFSEVAARFDRETSIQGQMNAMWAGYLLVQMRGIIDNPLPITSVGDVEKIFSMFRKTFNMDSAKGGATEGPQLEFLNDKGRRGEVIDIGPKKRGRPKKS